MAVPASRRTNAAPLMAFTRQNLDEEIAPGILWRDPSGRVRDDLALASIRRLKALAADEGAELWPNHDLTHWQRLRERGWPSLGAMKQT